MFESIKDGVRIAEDDWFIKDGSSRISCGIISVPAVSLTDNSLTYALYINGFFAIKKVIFNEPATIVLWDDGTKTVVKCGKDDVYDKEKGLALCFMKKALRNKGSYNNTFKKYIKENKDGKDNDNKSK